LLHTVQYTLNNIYLLYIIHYTIYTYCTVYTIQYIHTVQYTLYNIYIFCLSSASISDNTVEQIRHNNVYNLHIYFACLSVWWFICIQILCGTSHDPIEGLWMIKISKISLQQNSTVIKFWKTTKSANFFSFLFYNVLQCIHRENVHNWNKRWTRRDL